VQNALVKSLRDLIPPPSTSTHDGKGTGEDKSEDSARAKAKVDSENAKARALLRGEVEAFVPKYFDLAVIRGRATIPLWRGMSPSQVRLCVGCA
jgi:hypothetical protein